MRIFSGFNIWLICCSFSPLLLPAQSHGDSVIHQMENYLKNEQDPEKRLPVLMNLFREYEYTDTVKAREINDECFRLSRITGNYTMLAKAYNHRGFLYEDRGEVQKAMEMYYRFLETAEITGDKISVSKAYNNIGICHKLLGNFKDGLKFYHKSLEIDIARKDSLAMAGSYVNIGEIYRVQKNYKTALQYYHKAESIYNRKGNNYEKAVLYNNMAIALEQLDSIDVCRQYLRASAEYYLSENIISGYSTTITNLGLSFKETEQVDSCFFYCRLGLEYANISGDSIAIASSYKSLGVALIGVKQPEKALENLMVAMSFFTLHDMKEDLVSVYYHLANAYNDIGLYKESVDYLNKHLTLNEQIMDDKHAKLIAEMDARFKSVQKDQEISLKNAALETSNTKIRQQETENEKNKYRIYGLGGGMILLFALMAVVFINSKARKKANRLLEKQRDHIAEQNKEIKASITYAKRIQESILPSLDSIKKVFPESFVFYRPKDIVAGDFYFMEQLDEHIVLAVCDSTGHGVPGAMVSVVCSNALSRSIKEFKLIDPGEILNKARELVIENFSRSDKNVNDGMDTSLFVINTRTLSIKWAGANNPLWVIKSMVKGRSHEAKAMRNEMVDSLENISLMAHSSLPFALKEYKADKQPVGSAMRFSPFITHEIQVEKNDMLYLFTDGFADQFGGSKGKKFKTSNLKELFTAVAGDEIPKQNETITRAFDTWKGELEQIDDVCVIGIRI